MASAVRSATVEAPARTRRTATRSRPRPAPRDAPRPAERRPGSRSKRRANSRTAIAWIVVFGLLLAGVVFVNLAVLRLNLRLDGATQQRSKLRADNASLQSQLSAAVASPRIQNLAHNRDGLVQADPSSIDYINLGK